jgi:hypothetical protein
MNTLLCDFDGRLPRDLWKRIEMVARFHRFRVLGVGVGYSGSGKGFHVVVVTNKRLSPMRVVCLQAIIGSDWKRELFNSRRAAAWRRVPRFWRSRGNVLYSRHYKR